MADNATCANDLEDVADIVGRLRLDGRVIDMATFEALVLRGEIAGLHARIAELDLAALDVRLHEIDARRTTAAAAKKGVETRLADILGHDGVEFLGGGQEVAVVVVEGWADVVAGTHRFTGLGSRATVFDGPPAPVVLVAAGERVSVRTETGATIVTANTDEFKRIRGLKVENWLA